jgi:low temperature requirement protein LtrA
MLGASLLVVAGFLEGDARIAVWVLALAIDYLGPFVIGMGRGWRVAPEHFAERHGLIILIALGESIIAVGVGAGLELDAGVIAAATLGIVVVSALWWLYFDVAAIFARRRLIFLSTGAAAFKQNRGSAEWMEYEAVYDRHLAPHRRLPWAAFQALYDRGVKDLDTSQI